MKSFIPDTPYMVPAILKAPVSETIKGVPKKRYQEIDTIFVSFRTFGGTETRSNEQIVVENTGQLETWYRPDIKSDCRIAIAGIDYEILGTPENIGIQDANITDVRVFTQIISGGSICTKWTIWQAYFFNANGKTNAVQMHDSGAIVWDANTNGVHSLMIELVINMSAEDGSHTYGDKAMIALPDEYKDLEYSDVVYTGYILDSNGNMHSELYDSTGITRRLVVTKLKDGRAYIYVDPTLPPEYGSLGLATQYAHQVVFYATVAATETWQERTY
ncbi:MAG: hypothetical protein SOZ48_00880 [Eubacterium sp.]|nr:hypothetical protein [Eubacterium sp.]